MDDWKITFVIALGAFTLWSWNIVLYYVANCLVQYLFLFLQLITFQFSCFNYAILKITLIIILFILYVAQEVTNLSSKRLSLIIYGQVPKRGHCYWWLQATLKCINFCFSGEFQLRPKTTFRASQKLHENIPPLKFKSKVFTFCSVYTCTGFQSLSVWALTKSYTQRIRGRWAYLHGGRGP